MAEDAVQEALLAASTKWSADGLPDNPAGWLTTVAARRLTDLVRREQARRRREAVVAQWALPEQRLTPAADQSAADSDDTLILLFLCCHPSLSPASQIALTLRAVGGLTTAEIARAFLVPEATMTRRITRAKQQIAGSGVPFGLPAEHERAQRLAAVLHVLYLIFNEGYAPTSGPNPHRDDLAAEAIRLTRLLHRLLPQDTEAAGLLALMLLVDARSPARTAPDGTLVPLADQDRSLWRTGFIAEGVALITNALPKGSIGPYQLQAAIAAVHDEAPDAGRTDWPQISALYELLTRVSDNPVVALNRTVAVAKAHGAQAGLHLLAEFEADKRLADDHRLHAVRAYLLEAAGERTAARDAYQAAADRTTNPLHKRSLDTHIARLAASG
jgi:RNA polymerase sigma factor (sigma-70 family)